MIITQGGRARWVGAILGVLAIIAAFCVDVPAQLGIAKTEHPTKQRTTAGEMEFRLYCGSCHGVDATGDGPVAKALKKRPANLRILAKTNGGVFPEETVRDFIDGTKDIAAHGGREMPLWGIVFQTRSNAPADSLSPPVSQAEVDQRIDKLVDYIRSIQEN
jgi:mono/diheme cytochrome c family protein